MGNSFRFKFEGELVGSFGSLYVSGKLPTYSSPRPTLTLTSHLGQNFGLGEESVGSFPETYIDLANKAPLPETEIDILPSGLSLRFQVAG